VQATVEFGSQATDRPQSAALRRIDLSGIVGTAVEWYDFFTYATATALVFNRLFCPSDATSRSTIAAFATYAVGFFARPVGAAIFGHCGERIGRTSVTR
jgi:MHS family shikimate/dehydroshikimate transporter-like MFS transporter